jgi:hypothetical protein
VAELVAVLCVPRSQATIVESGARRARLAAEELARSGTPVRYMRSIFVLEDETRFFLFEAGSADAVQEAARHAALPFERIAEEIAEPRGEST